jgi:extracellular factor (EF) 3-hydroxypalmitic acid methyl ester biosynthesis protein
VQDNQSTTSNGLLGQGRRFLDEIHQEIRRDPLAVSHTMSNLLEGLHKVRSALPREDWQRFCKDVVSNHGLRDVIHQDPFTLHSVRKPRGYAGDAALLDYI